jgi:transposase
MRAAAFTLRGLVAELAEQGIKTDSRAVWVFAHEQKLSFKKTVRAAEQVRPDVGRASGRAGRPIKPASTAPACCSSTRLG